MARDGGELFELMARQPAETIESANEFEVGVRRSNGITIGRMANVGLIRRDILLAEGLDEVA